MVGKIKQNLGFKQAQVKHSFCLIHSSLMRFRIKFLLSFWLFTWLLVCQPILSFHEGNMNVIIFKASFHLWTLSKLETREEKSWHWSSIASPPYKSIFQCPCKDWSYSEESLTFAARLTISLSSKLSPNAKLISHTCNTTGLHASQ